MASESKYEIYHCEFNGRLVGSVGVMSSHKIQVRCTSNNILNLLYKHYAHVIMLRVFDEQNNELEVCRSSNPKHNDTINQVIQTWEHS